MNILSIDIGTYSVKFLEFRQEHRKLVLEHLHEVLIEESREDFPKDVSTREIQKEIISSHLQEIHFSGKIIQQIPYDLITTRFLNLPINNLKKAEMMIPFQLDDNLPFPTSNAHYTSEMIKEGNTYFAIVNVTQNDKFESHYQSLKNLKALPTHLYSELTAINAYTRENKVTGPICLIDMGHSTTKAYFIHKGKVLSNHTSHIAGNTITEVIAQTYQISVEEAVTYKHDNCFFLTDSMYEEVNEAQREFGTLMKQTFAPLISDIKRWELGFRVKNAIPLEKIYITGGTSNIENTDNFLSQALEIPVAYFDAPLSSKNEVELSKGDTNSFYMASLLGKTQSYKTQVSNLLKGDYVSSYSNTIPLHSAVFLATRIAIVSLILILALTVERAFLSSDSKKLNKHITKVLKSPSLELKPRERRQYKKKPLVVYKKIKRKERKILSSLKALKMDKSAGAITPLANLSRLIASNDNVDLVSFNFEGSIVMAKFTAKDALELQDVKKRLESSSLSSLRVDHKDGSKELTIEYRDN